MLTNTSTLVNTRKYYLSDNSFCYSFTPILQRPYWQSQYVDTSRITICNLKLLQTVHNKRTLKTMRQNDNTVRHTRSLSHCFIQSKKELAIAHRLYIFKNLLIAIYPYIQPELPFKMYGLWTHYGIYSTCVLPLWDHNESIAIYGYTNIVLINVWIVQ